MTRLANLVARLGHSPAIARSITEFEAAFGSGSLVAGGMRIVLVAAASLLELARPHRGHTPTGGRVR